MQVLPLTFLPGESPGMMAPEPPVSGMDFLVLLQGMDGIAIDPRSVIAVPDGADGPASGPAGDDGAEGGAAGDSGDSGAPAVLPLAGLPVPGTMRMTADSGPGADLRPASEAAVTMGGPVWPLVSGVVLRAAGARATIECGGMETVVRAAPDVVAQAGDAAAPPGATPPLPDAGAVLRVGDAPRLDRMARAADSGTALLPGTILPMTAALRSAVGEAPPRATTTEPVAALPGHVLPQGAGDRPSPQGGDPALLHDGAGAPVRPGALQAGVAPVQGAPVVELPAARPDPAAPPAPQRTGDGAGGDVPSAGDDAPPLAPGAPRTAPAGTVPVSTAPRASGGADTVPVGPSDRPPPSPDAGSTTPPAPQAGPNPAPGAALLQAGAPSAPGAAATAPDRPRPPGDGSQVAPNPAPGADATLADRPRPPDDGLRTAAMPDDRAAARTVDTAGAGSTVAPAHRDPAPAVPGPAPGAATVPRSADGPPDALHRTRLAVRSLAPGITEIRLDPPELGALRLDLQTRGAVAHLRIAAEQAQVLDLMRGSLHTLTADLRSLGFERVEIALDGSFRAGADGGTRADGGAGQHGGDDAHPPPATPVPGDPPPGDPQPRRVRAGATLDLRL